jgi:hypothetical protein
MMTRTEALETLAAIEAKFAEIDLGVVFPDNEAIEACFDALWNLYEQVDGLVKTEVNATGYKFQDEVNASRF